MKAACTQVVLRPTMAGARDMFSSKGHSPYFLAHFKGNAKQRRTARRSYIRFAISTCAARDIPLYINGILQ